MSHNDQSFEDYYRQFEDRFRGSEQDIKQRLSSYLPLLAGLAKSQTARRALDLGSGRGEWLSLLSETGWIATGVEPNRIAEAAKGIDAKLVSADALDYLRTCAPHSFELITAFHVVEHLETNYLLAMLEEIQRVLVPGGLMILETPNPENLTVASWSFHLDPTHKAPLPPLLLQYFVEHAGFTAPEVVRVNGSREPFDLGPISNIVFTLFRSSLDYAIVAKTARENDDGFAELIRRFALQTSQRNPSNTDTIGELARTADQSIIDLRHLIEKKDHEIAGKDLELASIYKSTSWKITEPLRDATRFVRTFRSSIRHQVSVRITEALVALRKYPRLKAAAISASRLAPPLERRLKRLAEPWSPRATPWSIDANPNTLADWTAIVRERR
jgi:SAM-dependent methyltransferase